MAVFLTSHLIFGTKRNMLQTRLVAPKLTGEKLHTEHHLMHNYLQSTELLPSVDTASYYLRMMFMVKTIRA